MKRVVWAGVALLIGCGGSSATLPPTEDAVPSLTMSAEAGVDASVDASTDALVDAGDQCVGDPTMRSGCDFYDPNPWTRACTVDVGGCYEVQGFYCCP